MAKFRLKPQPPPKLSENDVERACIDLLRVRGWYVVRLQSGLFKTPDGRFVRVGEKGLPDYVALHAVYPAFFLETKRPRRDTGAEQERKHWELTGAYHLAVVVIDRVESLKPWLDGFEQAIREGWKTKGV